jgi:hypothetical protein
MCVYVSGADGGDSDEKSLLMVSSSTLTHIHTHATKHYTAGCRVMVMMMLVTDICASQYTALTASNTHGGCLQCSVQHHLCNVGGGGGGVSGGRVGGCCDGVYGGV